MQRVRSKLLFAGAATLFVTNVALAEVPEWIRGKIIANDFESVGPARESRSDATLQSSLSLYSTVAPNFGNGFSGKGTIRGTAFRRSLEKGTRSFFEGDVQELWAGYSKDGLDFRMGEILTPWGRSDVVNPTDFLTAKNLTLLSTGDEIRRRGAPGIRASFVPEAGASPLEFTFAWTARYPQTKMLIPSRGIPAGITVETDPSTPDFFSDSEEWALKIAYQVSSFDVSISGFSGRNHFGQFYFDGSKVGLTFERERAFGADFSWTFNDFVIRGESAAYFYESGAQGRSGYSLTEPNHWDSVLGVERAFGPRFRTLAQMLYRVHPGQRDPGEYVGTTPTLTAIGRGLGAANALIQNYQQKSEVGATVLGTYSSADEDWIFEVGALGNFFGGDFVVRPKVTHRLRESLHATLGMDYYGGPPEKTLGALRDYRSAYLEGVYDF